MSKLDRLAKLPGSKSTGKKPTQSELGVLVKELQANAMAQKQSQADITAAIKQLSQVVVAASKDGFDVSKIVDAITGLTNRMAEKDRMSMPANYEINFERDKFGLMKTGIQLTAMDKRKLN